MSKRWIKMEKLIKSKKRVEKHGEVFTPKWMVNKMLDTPGIVEETYSLESTFLEPSVGEGIFLMEILKRKLSIVKKKYNDNLTMYENYSLFVLSTLYGVELLHDNHLSCVMNVNKVYEQEYEKVCISYSKRPKKNILKSASLILKRNIVQGDFLTGLNSRNNKIVFNEWKPEFKNNEIVVLRTEYTLEDIKNKQNNDSGSKLSYETEKQLSIFDILEEKPEEIVKYVYVPCKIRDVHKEVMEEIIIFEK